MYLRTRIRGAAGAAGLGSTLKRTMDIYLAEYFGTLGMHVQDIWLGMENFQVRGLQFPETRTPAHHHAKLFATAS